jgi:hypothetical protein
MSCPHEITVHHTATLWCTALCACATEAILVKLPWCSAYQHDKEHCVNGKWSAAEMILRVTLDVLTEQIIWCDTVNFTLKQIVLCVAERRAR